MPKCLFLPLDGRPCNARFPVELAKLGNVSVRQPDTRLLGNAKDPASLHALDRWLNAACEVEVPDYLFLSLDTWVYGNLVASRKSTQSLSNAQERLNKIKALKQKYPQIKICVMATLLRMSNSNDATEERPYWAKHGKQIYRYAYLDHFLDSHSEDANAQAEAARLKQVIPSEVLKDYQELRHRNHQILKGVMQGINQQWIEHALFGCDDSGEYGWSVQERQQLMADRTERKLEKKLLIYPGADELASVLFARVLVPKTYHLQVQWTHPKAQDIVTRYEGQPLSKTLLSQAKAAGLTLELEQNKAETDGVLWVHQPSKSTEQVDQFLDRDTRQVLPSETYETIKTELQTQHLPVMLADVFYANGGDEQLLNALGVNALALQGYSAWNTTGNTLGYLLAWFKFYLWAKDSPDFSEKNQKLVMERIADDGLYQGIWRQKWCNHYLDPVTLNTCVQGIYAFNERFKVWAKEDPDIAKQGTPEIKQLSFPWRRFFEIDLQICWPESKACAR